MLQRTSLALLVAVTLLRWTDTGASLPVTRCSPASHICEGVCPRLPSVAELPPAWGDEGLCLKDSETGVCVCWLPNPLFDDEQRHYQTLFRYEMVANGTVRHVMCRPPPICFPPNAPGLGCMIVLQCPCTSLPKRGGRFLRPDHPDSRWLPVVAILLRSKTLESGPETQEDVTEKPQGNAREFSVKHLLFLLAFVVAPLLCWCLLTFFHEGKCRRKRGSEAETEPMPTVRVEEVASEAASCAPPPEAPTAPKIESPPQYEEALDPGESCPLAVDCGPPPSYEDAMRDQGWQMAVNHRIQEV